MPKFEAQRMDRHDYVVMSKEFDTLEDAQLFVKECREADRTVLSAGRPEGDWSYHTHHRWDGANGARYTIIQEWPIEETSG